MKHIYSCEYCGKTFDSEAECQEHETKCNPKKKAEAKKDIIAKFHALIDALNAYENAYGGDAIEILEEDVEDIMDSESEKCCGCCHDCEADTNSLTSLVDSLIGPKGETKVETHSHFYLNGKEVSEEDYKKALKDFCESEDDDDEEETSSKDEFSFTADMNEDLAKFISLLF